MKVKIAKRFFAVLAMTSAVGVWTGIGAVPAAWGYQSCRHFYSRGNVGYVGAQLSPNGYLPWTASRYRGADNFGFWYVDVWVDNRRVDHKQQFYEPHGTINPKYLHRGATVQWTGYQKPLDEFPGQRDYAIVGAICTMP